VTHLGQRLSALIDGELDGSERERVLVHLSGCDSCRDEVAALRMLKRRTSALGQDASGVGAALTGRLIGLSALVSLQEREDADQPPPDSSPDRPTGGLPGRGPGSPEQRAGRYFLAGSLAIFLAGLGTAAVIAGGESQPQAPTLPVTPSVDVMVFSPPRGGGPAADRPDASPASLSTRPGSSSPHPVRSGS
jgi:anti-sigma factor RsiW